MFGKSMDEYESIIERVKALAQVETFNVRIVSTDMEKCLENLAKRHFGSAIHKTCRQGYKSYTTLGEFTYNNI